jgi:predicted methyltransferase
MIDPRTAWRSSEAVKQFVAPSLRERGSQAARLAALIAVLLVAGCAGMTRPGVDYEHVVAAPDRSEADRKTDQRRDPVELLAFTGARPGMKVLDMGAGGGYSTELLARAVAPGGVVYGQNSPESAKGDAALHARASRVRNIVPVQRPFDDPVPAGVRNLDLITFFFAYHDTPNMGIDRARMNRSLFAALKPGGQLVIADHAARAGDGISVSRTLHRIEESTLQRELEAAGFRLVDHGDFLRNPQDRRDVVVFKSPVKVDEFVLKFEKPR